MSQLVRLIDAVTETLGRLVAWLTLVMGLVTAAIVILRYGCQTGSIAAQESVLYMHAFAFMLGIAYTMKHDEHVRVDVLYARLSARGRAWVNLIGHLTALLPCAVTFFWVSLDYVLASWSILEGSSEVGGIPGVFLLKSLIPVMAVLLLVQGAADAIRAIAVIRRGAVAP